MAKRTLLDMVQAILSAIDGDEVNSISDTIEATQVANTVKQAYFDLVDEMDLPHNQDLISLTALGDDEKPTHFLIPEEVNRVDWVKYDVRLEDADDKQYRDLIYKEPKDFVDYVVQRRSTDTDNYLTVEYTSNIPLLIYKKSGPRYWTSFDDEYVVCDSYDEDIDDSLQESKVIAFGSTLPTFTLDDDFIPDLPDNLFYNLYAQAESIAFTNYKQEVNPKSEQRENRSRIRANRAKWKSRRNTPDWPDYGRKC